MSRISKSRVDESRTLDERNVEERLMFNMNWSDPYYVPPEMIPEDKVYHWIRTSIRDVPDTTRSTFAANTGWTPVPPDRHPQLCSKDLFGENKYIKNYIFRTGLILCEKSKHIHLAEQREINRRTAEQVGTLPGLDNFLGSEIPMNRPDIRVEYTKGYDAPKNNNLGGGNVNFSW